MADYVAYKLPDGCDLQPLTDQSVFIKQSIDEVRGNAIVGGGIAVFVIFLFLETPVIRRSLGLQYRYLFWRPSLPCNCPEFLLILYPWVDWL